MLNEQAISGPTKMFNNFFHSLVEALTFSPLSLVILFREFFINGKWGAWTQAHNFLVSADMNWGWFEPLLAYDSICNSFWRCKVKKKKKDKTSTIQAWFKEKNDDNAVEWALLLLS